MIDQADHNADDVRREALAWVSHMRSGEATMEDAAALRRWRALSAEHGQALHDAINLQRFVKAGAAAREVLSATQVAPPTPAAPDRVGKPIGRRALIGGVIAASAGGLMMVRPPLELWPSVAELSGDYRTAPGERRRLQLAQGASVELNTRTSIAMREDGRGPCFELIAGEAAIEVASDRPVIVRAGGGEAAASAGNFTVRLVDDGVQVTCLTGRVGVAAAGRNIDLRAAQRASYGDGAAPIVEAVDANTAEAWREGRIIFSGERLDAVVAELNRYRSGRIIVTNAELGRIPVNAVFMVDRMDRAVSQLSGFTDARVTNLPGGIVLLS